MTILDGRLPLEVSSQIRRTVKLFSLVLPLCGQLLTAQDVPRLLTGTVQDSHHEPLRGAIVEVENENTSGVISYITSEDGRFVFKRLSDNLDYKVWATYRGRRSKVKEMSHLESKPDKVVNFIIRPY